jgi:predicted RNA methylase
MQNPSSPHNHGRNSIVADVAFSSLDCVGQCLTDRMRSKQFDRAIRSVVQPHHTVIDVGTGSGLLALFAARAGARRVVAIEFDPYIAEVARENVRNNGYEQVVKVIEADARACRFEPGAAFDVVIMEMLTTGMVDEFQVPAINNLHRQGVVNSSTIFVPCRQETFAALAHTKFEIYGLEMRMVRHLWEDFRGNQRVECLSRPQPVSSTDFSSPCAETSAQILEFEAVESGLVNSVYLTSRTCLTPQISLKDTLTLNAPVAVPVEERMVTKGERVTMDVSYLHGGGYKNFRASFPFCKTLAEVPDEPDGPESASADDHEYKETRLSGESC